MYQLTVVWTHSQVQATYQLQAPDDVIGFIRAQGEKFSLIQAKEVKP